MMSDVYKSKVHRVHLIMLFLIGAVAFVMLPSMCLGAGEFGSKRADEGSQVDRNLGLGKGGRDRSTGDR